MGTHSLSVVIATLGGDSLCETIRQLNRGTLIPDEILVCIPADDAHRVEGLSFPNVAIVRTACRGQVAQRAVGFRQARHPFVLQLDDDISVREDCLQQLVEFCTANPGASVGPKLYDRATGRYHAFLAPTSERLRFRDRLLFWVINGSRGYQPGRISASGVNVGVPDRPDDWYDLDWLSGGCVLHRREQLVLEDFYPFPGKAFAEDLFHSALLRDNGVRLLRCGAAVCDADLSSSGSRGIVSGARDYLEYAKRMTVLARRRGCSVVRLYAFLLLNVVTLAIRRASRRRISAHA